MAARPDARWTTGTPYLPAGHGLHQRVADHAAATPDAVALRTATGTVSYRTLDRTANALAAGLAGAGAGAGHVLPVVLPRGVDLVTALLAVLKTGAGYALLDPAWPEHRRREVITQLAAPLVVESATPGPADPSGFRPVPVAGTDPCSVFFTSGTTGRPKGVLTTHDATARLFGTDTFARFGRDTVIPLAAPAPWDAFSLELWSALLSGGSCLIVDEPYLSAHSLRAGIAGHGVNTVWLTSSLFNLIVDEDLDAFAGLDQVMIGGERLSTSHVRRFLGRHGDIELTNGYGPVESTVFATTHRITGADGDIPIGRPVPGTGIHVLDGTRPCAVGETGEICVSGHGLAIGYLGDPDLTAARFTTVDLDGRPVRVYRTGDLGTWDDTGALRYLGRADRQVKIRGHRIEPAEVERQVERLLPGVRACHVLARRDEAGNATELVAFCVPADEGDPLDGALGTLRAGLVSYQRPTAVVSVDAFPVTARGKLDETALLAMAVPTAEPQAPPATHHDDPLTSAVAETVAAVLGRAVPAGAGFFESGGTSLAAGRVCARLAARLGRPVPVSVLYREPTVAALAGWLRDTAPSTRELPDGPAPLTAMQRMYLVRHLVDEHDTTAHCLLTWIVDGELDLAALASAVGSVHERHEPLRAAYLIEPEPVAELLDVDPPPVERLPAQPSVEVAVHALRTALAEPLAPEDADLWRVMVAPVDGTATTVLGCVVHHIAFDGASESVLATELATAYRAGTLPAPPSLAAQHRHQLHRVRHDHTATLATELAGTPPLRWPAGRTEPGPTGHLDTLIGPAAIAGVDGIAASAGVSRFVVLLWLFARTVAEITGQDDFAVGVPVARRDGQDLDRAIGCHLGMICPRLRGPALTGGPGGLAETGRIVREAMAGQDVPLPDVLAAADLTGGDRPPVYQVLFALQDNPIPRLDLPGARTRFLRQPYLDLPLELHAELWPDDDGGLVLDVGFRPGAVPEATAREIAKRFADRVRTTDLPPATTRGVRP